jgi:hypothetical protein
VRRVTEVENPDQSADHPYLLIESFIREPKTPATKKLPANDDAFLFTKDGEPAWTYGYDVCFAWEDCENEDFSRDFGIV